MLNGTFCGPPTGGQSQKSEGKRMFNSSNSEKHCLQWLSPGAEPASNPYTESAKGQRIPRDSMYPQNWEAFWILSLLSDKGEWVTFLLSLKMTSKKDSKESLVEMEMPAKRKTSFHSWTGRPSRQDARQGKTGGRCRRAEPREEAGGNSLSFYHYIWQKIGQKGLDLSHPYTAGDEFPATRGCAVHAGRI